jgi:sulfoxide reductase heme-binding subunit YedZ
VTGRDPLEVGWWLASRASGVTALVLVSLSVGIGLSMAGRIPNRPKLKKRLVATHEHLALAGLVAIAVHGITLLGDRWLHPGPLGIVVPFVMDREPVFTGLGILGGWLAALLGLSFYVRRRIGAALWRRLHRATIVVWALAVVHTLGAGSDAGAPWLQAVLLLTGAPVVFLFIARVLPRERPDRVSKGACTSSSPGATGRSAGSSSRSSPAAATPQSA